METRENRIINNLIKKHSWEFRFALALVAAMVLIYTLHYAMFHDLHYIEEYTLLHLGFIPIDVIVVTFVIDRVLGRREMSKKMDKLNMVIGTFFSDTGNQLIEKLSVFNAESDEMSSRLKPDMGWAEKDFDSAKAHFKDYRMKVDITLGMPREVKTFLSTKRNFLLRLLENSNLLEHEAFTDLLWAVFHMTDEFERREGFKKLPAEDLSHLEGDISRAYSLLILEWLEYMRHMKTNYPYLYSLAVRTNPFDDSSNPVIGG